MFYTFEVLFFKTNFFLSSCLPLNFSLKILDKTCFLSQNTSHVMLTNFTKIHTEWTRTYFPFFPFSHKYYSNWITLYYGVSQRKLSLEKVADVHIQHIQKKKKRLRGFWWYLKITHIIYSCIFDFSYSCLSVEKCICTLKNPNNV